MADRRSLLIQAIKGASVWFADKPGTIRRKANAPELRSDANEGWPSIPAAAETPQGWAEAR